jgi:excisionase family DNA binding protein
MIGKVTPQMLYSPEQVAERLGLHVRTIRNYVRGGRLRAVRIGKQYRIASKDLAKLTGQPPSAFESKPSAGQIRSEVSSIVDIDAISPDMANRLTSLLMGASHGRGKRDTASRVQAIYDPDRMHMKVILVGTFDDNATYFSLVEGLLRS